MKRISAALLGSLLSLSAVASSPTLPSVTCELSTQYAMDGSFDHYETAPAVKVSLNRKDTSLTGFIMHTKLNGIRAASSGPMPVVGYELVVELNKGLSSSSFMTHVTPGHHRYSASLAVGNELAFVNCDVN